MYNRIADEANYGGIGDSAAAGARIAARLGNHGIMVMGSTEILVTGVTVAQALKHLLDARNSSCASSPLS